MSATGSELLWDKAAETAGRIAQRWAADEPGGAIILFDADGFRAEICGGLESLATRTPFSVDSVVRYASITKHIFNGLALAHEDEVGLDDPLGKHLPRLQGPMAEVTVGRALDMTGGLPDARDTLLCLGVALHTETTAPAIMNMLYSLGAVNFPAGHEISYSNAGYWLAEAALETKGHRLADMVRQRIAQPLGITMQVVQSWFDPVVGLAPGYWRSDSGWQLAAAGIHLAASGSIAGSARALATWLQSLVGDRGPGAGMLARLSAPRHLADGRETQYGLGLAWSTLGQRRLVGHGGSHAGYKTYFLLDPDHRAGVALVSNREDTTSSSFALEIMASLLGEPLPPRSTALPDGLYATAEGPFWLEVRDNVATFLGVGEALYDGGDGWAISLSAHVPMRLRWTGIAIEGEVGHVARRFLPVTPDDCLSRVQGEWVCAAQHATFTITGDRLETGAGAARSTAPLVSLGGGRLLLEGRDGPWPKRASLVFDGDEVAVTLNRSRVIRYRRAA